MRGTAVVTGASSGIGAATAAALRADGWEVVVAARREDRLRAVAEPLGARWYVLDVRDRTSVERFAAEVGECLLLVNNAGGAHGLEPVAEADDDHWRVMWETHGMGVMYGTPAFLPAPIAAGEPHRGT